MRFPSVVTIAVLLLSVQCYGTSPPSILAEESWSASTEAQIKARIGQLRLPFSPQPSSRVMNYIRDYVVVGSAETEVMLGRSFFFMPVFEHYLGLYQLPKELKYLPMVESGLKTDTRSSAGARGLWQLMEVTARQYKLQVNNLADERLDPFKSTEAAVQMLSDLYDQYQDWPLTIAAYNCGPSRVNKAIRLAGCKDYDEVSRFLPVETQRYVPAFVAAAYVHNHYGDHNLSPKVFEPSEGGVRVFRISSELNLIQAAKVCNISYNVLRQLNPAFPGGVIPASATGYYFTIPASASVAFRDWLGKKQGYIHAAHADNDAYHTTYVTASGEGIELVARRFQVTVEDIMRWNNLKVREVVVNQELNIYLSKEFLLRRV
jgi:membrane-bound lytic murein transglycosylase D